jgi:hypothetical protein
MRHSPLRNRLEALWASVQDGADGSAGREDGSKGCVYRDGHHHELANSHIDGYRPPAPTLE